MTSSCAGVEIYRLSDVVIGEPSAAALSHQQQQMDLLCVSLCANHAQYDSDEAAKGRFYPGHAVNPFACYPTERRKAMKKIGTLATKTAVMLGALSLSLCAGLALAAGDAQKEIDTAIKHAQFAAKMSTVDQTHLHLHHVVNCLVGPNGQGFDAKAGNPCKGQGNGAINDAKAGSDQQKLLEDALVVAEIGLDNTRPAPAIGTARAVIVLLQEAGNAM